LFWGVFLKNKPRHPQTLQEVLKRWGSNEAFIEQQYRCFNEYRSNIGVCCFSESPKKILMWSHYANDHKGIVYEFTTDLFSGSTSESFKGCRFKVDYAKDNKYELLSYALTGKLKEDQFVKGLLTKANEWKYEEEYRFIDLNGSENKSFKKESLKSIIFGVKTETEPDEIIRIKNLCQEYGFQHVVFKQIKFLPGEFKITLVDI
jgi:hypothetical protein